MNNNTHTDDQRLLELLEKWQQGDYTLADERELQALAQADDFRKEVVEGYWLNPELAHQDVLTRLQEKLKGSEKDERRKTVLLWPRFAALAAALLLLLVAVWFIAPGRQQNEQSIAKSQETQTQVNSPTAPILNDQQNTKNATDILDKKENSNRDIAFESKNSKTAPTVSRDATDYSSQNLAKQRPETAGAAPEADLSSSEENKDVMLRSEAAKPAPSAPAKADDAETAPVTMNEIAVDERPGNSDKVAASRAKKSTGQSAVVTEWDSFRTYLNRNAKLPDAAKNNNISGYVRVRFNLDAALKVQNLIIINSLGFGCDEEALRLIRAYTWKRQPDKSNPMEVEVPFIR